MRFLGIAAELREDLGSSSGHSPSKAESNSGRERQLVIGEQVFANCSSLRQVIFGPGSDVTKIQRLAFWNSGLESLSCPRCGRLACRLQRVDLTTFELNKNMELDWLCL